MSDMDNQKQRKEDGFILVTAIMLIAILTILGTVSFLKTNIEIKVSRTSGNAAKALSAANGGLVQGFVEWQNARAAEWASMTTDLVAGGTTTDVYLPALNPGSMDVLRTKATAAAATASSCTNSTTDVLDNYICWADGTGTNPLLRVYELQGGAMNVVANDTWGSGTNSQAAVWTSGFKEPQYGYPYDTPGTGAGCPLCTVVTYSLGRSGTAKRLVREVQGAVIQTLQGATAITNTPQYANWDDACHGTNSSEVGDALSWPPETIPDFLIEMTQAPFLLGGVPSGTGMVSNTTMGVGKRLFRNKDKSESSFTTDSTPLIAYATHGTASGVRVKWADTTIDATAADDPDPDLPKDIMLSGLSVGSGKIDYFLSGNAQLFNLDAYRWAAEQFTCQDPGNSSAANGEFCDKAEALRIAMSSPVPVTGRLTVAQFEKNVADGRPMFGIVRVMYPTEHLSYPNENCESAGGREIELFDVDKDVNTIKIGNGEFYEATDDSKVIVYGMLLLDYFIDHNGDYYFDAPTERLIEPLESVDAYLKIEIPFIVNPAIPDDAGDGGNFYTIAATTAPAGSTNSLATANRVNPGDTSDCTSCRSIANLASPYDGWFPISEGMLDVDNDEFDGSMELMDRTHGTHITGLIGAAFEMEQAGGATVGTQTGTLFTNYKDRLNYYYELMYTTTDQSDSFSWPITGVFPTSTAVNFCIGARDCTTGNNEGDKFHLLFPNGYTHGVKVALAALDMTADEWNNVLSGNGGITITDLKDKHATLTGYDVTALNPFGSPFGKDDDVTDPGMADAATIQADQSDYFFITKDATTGYGIIDSEFADLPSVAYSGGLIDSHHFSNIGGILYTPGPLEWEPGNKDGLGYIAGSVITGFGLWNKTGGDSAHQVYVFDPQSVDQISVQTVFNQMQRYAWQELK